MTRPALFRRIPSFRAPASDPLLPRNAAQRSPDLESDLEVLRQELFPGFEELDRTALSSQHGFRLAQVLLIVGGLIATVLGAIQTALAGSRWAGIAETVLLAALGGVFRFSGDLNFKQDYLDQRLKAERMRAECFFYLARAGPYSGLDPAALPGELQHRVALITTGTAANG
jgi:hypothetical protein